MEAGTVGNSIPLNVSKGGLEEIAAGLEKLRAGKVSAQKLAYVL